MRPVFGLLITGAVLTLVGCSRQGPQTPLETTLSVWNRSQFELLALLVHDGPSYASAPNLLDEPLASDAMIEVPLTSGQRTTVIRQKVAVGDRLALTTAVDLDVDQPGYTLIVFDESFRLLAPGESEL